MNQLQELLKSDAGKPIKQFLLSHYLRLKSIDNIKDCETEKAQALEVKATKKAVEILKDILSEIINIENFENKPKAEEDKLFIL